MQKVLVLAAAAILVIAIALVGVPGSALAYRGTVQVCIDYANLGLGSQGACVSYLETLFNAGNADVVILCKDPIISAAFRNQGECVTALQGYGFN